MYMRLADDPTYWLIRDGYRIPMRHMRDVVDFGAGPLKIVGRDELEQYEQGLNLLAYFADLASGSTRLILVSGPQRSGTTIAATMIARETGYTLHREEAFGAHDKGQWLELIDGAESAVIQCPAMSAYVHEQGAVDVLIIWMVRPVDEIVASQKRIGWPEMEAQRELARYGLQSGEPAEVKYQYWQDVQRDRVERFIELPYRLLRGHPLWASKEQRAEWHARQVTP